MHHSQEDLVEATEDAPDIEEVFGEPEDKPSPDEVLPDDVREEDLGATGRHPGGKMAEHDEGEIQVAVFDHEDKVLMNFGKKIQSVGMTPEQAKSLGGTLLNRARKAKSDRR